MFAVQLSKHTHFWSRACHQNRSIYDVLNLESRVNVSEVLTFANNPNLQDALDNIKQRLNVEGQIVILLPSAKKKLEELAESSPSIPFDVYTEVVILFVIIFFMPFLSFTVLALFSVFHNAKFYCSWGKRLLNWTSRNLPMYFRPLQPKLMTYL